ncbi:MAG: hypothetical protein LBI92_07735 [Azoarcus sp.]|jgi:hypothetical protein|nr:hypothetical protein [Azoarcus sp.]
MNDKTTETPRTAAHWADDIAAHVGTYGNGLWLPGLSAWLSMPGLDWLPNPLEEAAAQGGASADADNDEEDEPERVDVPVPTRGVQLVFYAMPSYAKAPEKMRLHHIVLERAIFNATLIGQHHLDGALPFSLDIRTETPASAAEKLKSDDVTKREASISYFLDDNRVVAIDFKAGLSGIRQVMIVRLWKPIEF